MTWAVLHSLAGAVGGIAKPQNNDNQRALGVQVFCTNIFIYLEGDFLEMREMDLRVIQLFLFLVFFVSC